MNKKPARFEIVTPKGYRRKSLPFFQEWVDALESGNFRQVTGTLAEPKGSKSLGYCCLGVLCRVQGRLVKDRAENEWYDQSPLFNPNDEWDGSGKNDNMRSAGDIAGSNPSYKALRNNGNFPKEVWVIMNDNRYTSLVDCNDSAKLTFKEIAQVIRRIWKA